VRVFNKDQNHLFGTFLALPNIRLMPTSDTVLRFHERPRNAPEALRAWFYPGDSWGHEFVYPRAKAVELAKAENIPVLSADVRPAEKPEELMQAPVMAVTPENKEVEVAQVVEAPPQRPAPVAAAAPVVTPSAEPVATELPKTGSSLPLVALMGLFSLALAGAVRRLAHTIS
jgi:LPXTG-motif cell wall-anchored protein